VVDPARRSVLFERYICKERNGPRDIDARLRAWAARV